MVDSMFVVKANPYDLMPFAAFPDEESAAECVASMHPGADLSEVVGLVKRVPIFAGYRSFEDLDMAVDEICAALDAMERSMADE